MSSSPSPTPSASSWRYYVIPPLARGDREESKDAIREITPEEQEVPEASSNEGEEEEVEEEQEEEDDEEDYDQENATDEEEKQDPQATQTHDTTLGSIPLAYTMVGSGRNLILN